MWDTVIVGGAAAGLSAGVVLARAQFSTLVVDGGEPRNKPADRMHGYLSRDGMVPTDFVATGRREYADYGGTRLRATVVDARRAGDDAFELRLDDGRAVGARSLLVATGLTDELPDVPGLAERWASTVHHCPHCHGYEVLGRRVVVLGSAMEAVSRHLAALMRRYSEAVTFCTNGVEIDEAERARLTAYGVRLADGTVTRVSGTGEMVVHVEGGATVGCDAIFVAPRPAPHDAVLTALGARTDPATGLVAVDAAGATSVPGVWAAGNVVDPRAQVVTAASAGSVAGIAMTGWLLDRDMTAAVSAARPIGGGAR